MARTNGNGNNNGNNGKVSGKIKFVMLEAEINDGNINEIMQAIGAAVRPQTIVQQIAPPSAPTGLLSGDNAAMTSQPSPSVRDNGQASLTFAGDENSSTEQSVTKNKVEKTQGDTQPRTFPQPKALNGINWNGNGIPVKEFADAKKPDGHLNRFVVIAAWFRLHGNLATISLAHVFTAYQMVGWKWEVDKDMAQMFRDGMRPQKRWYESDNKGSYTIGDLGLNAAKKMGGDLKYDTQTAPSHTTSNDEKTYEGQSGGQDEEV